MSCAACIAFGRPLASLAMKRLRLVLAAREASTLFSFFFFFFVILMLILVNTFNGCHVAAAATAFVVLAL